MQWLRDDIIRSYNLWLADQADIAWDKVEYMVAKQYVLDHHEEDIEDQAGRIDTVLSGSDPGFNRIKTNWINNYVSNNASNMESNWLAAKGLHKYSDILNNYEINWPVTVDEFTVNMEELADEYHNIVHMPVTVNQDYHANPKTTRSYTIEPDLSIETPSDRYTGLEFISPPLSFTDAVIHLQL